MNNIKILYYDRIDVSERFNVNKTSKSKECDILLMISMNFRDIVILNIKSVDYCCIISE